MVPSDVQTHKAGEHLEPPYRISERANLLRPVRRGGRVDLHSGKDLFGLAFGSEQRTLGSVGWNAPASLLLVCVPVMPQCGDGLDRERD